jgi:hypothetical protein
MGDVDLRRTGIPVRRGDLHHVVPCLVRTVTCQGSYWPSGSPRDFRPWREPRRPGTVEVCSRPIRAWPEERVVHDGWKD